MINQGDGQFQNTLDNKQIDMAVKFIEEINVFVDKLMQQSQVQQYQKENSEGFMGQSNPLQESSKHSLAHSQYLDSSSATHASSTATG